MKICVVQTRPIKGDIGGNIDSHKRFIMLAVSHGARVVIFPELSLTGYEPTLAQMLATTADDGRLGLFQEMSDHHEVTIGVGVPTKNEAGICISMVLFQPYQTRQIYHKRYLHGDEEPFFVGGANFPYLKVNGTHIGLAICYELSVSEHAEAAHSSGAEMYVASVAKSVSGVEQATQRLSEIAQGYGWPVLMSNCVGPSEDFVSAGKTAVWNEQGVLVGQLGETEEGIVIYDTETQEVIVKY